MINERDINSSNAPLLNNQKQEDITITQLNWDGLNSLISAANKDNFNESINLALDGAKQIINADVLAIYIADNKKPGATLLTVSKNSSNLPLHIPIQDILSLREPYTWLPSNSPKTTLHHSAKLLKFNYMISVPLGEENAIIGLFIIASTNRRERDNEIQIAKLVASSISSIISNYSNLSNVRNELEQKENQISIHSCLEEYISEGFILLNENFTISRINQTAEQLLGYSNEEINSQPLTNILISNKEIIPAVNKVQHERRSIRLENLQIYRRNGESFLAIINIFPINKNNLSSSETGILIQDLSEQEEIRNHAQQLEQRAFLGEITAIFAHEVRNPINNISTGLQLMALNLPPDDHNQKAIDRMQQECDRLEELMKSVLSFSRTTSYKMATIELPPILRRLIDRLHSKMARDNIDYTLQVDAEVPHIKGNIRALEQVFNNLINNAFQAMGASGGKLAIKIQKNVTEDNRVYVEVSVADNGPGIPDEIRKKLFSPFFTTKKNGSGLGLAITKRIVSAHNGMIKVDSFPGGSVFIVRFPAISKN